MCSVLEAFNVLKAFLFLRRVWLPPLDQMAPWGVCHVSSSLRADISGDRIYEMRPKPFRFLRDAGV